MTNLGRERDFSESMKDAFTISRIIHRTHLSSGLVAKAGTVNTWRLMTDVKELTNYGKLPTLG